MNQSVCYWLLGAQHRDIGLLRIKDLQCKHESNDLKRRFGYRWCAAQIAKAQHRIAREFTTPIAHHQ